MATGFYIQNETSRRQIIRLKSGGSLILHPKGTGTRDTAFVPVQNAEDSVIASLLLSGKVTKVGEKSTASKRDVAAAERKAKADEARKVIEASIQEPTDSIVKMQCAGVTASGAQCKSMVSVVESTDPATVFCARHKSQPVAVDGAEVEATQAELTE